MKKQFLLFITILFLFLTINKDIANAGGTLADNCVAIKVTFSATNWSGGSIEIGCDGDNGNFDGISGNDCTGQTHTFSGPNKTFTLTKCSCPPFADGCLKVGKNLTLKKDGPNNRPRIHGATNKITNKCTVSHAKACGENGNTITASVVGTCKLPPTNGECDATHYNCKKGTSTNNVDGNSSWTWQCKGSDNGTTASCSEPKPTVPPIDVCPNIGGDQAVIPPGMIKDAAGNCVTPPAIFGCRDGIWSGDTKLTNSDKSINRILTLTAQQAQNGAPLTCKNPLNIGSYAWTSGSTKASVNPTNAQTTNWKTIALVTVNTNTNPSLTVCPLQPTPTTGPTRGGGIGIPRTQPNPVQGVAVSGCITYPANINITVPPIITATCNQPCSSLIKCQTGLVCHSTLAVCRNPNNLTSTTCVPPSSTYSISGHVIDLSGGNAGANLTISYTGGQTNTKPDKTYTINQLNRNAYNVALTSLPPGGYRLIFGNRTVNLPCNPAEASTGSFNCNGANIINLDFEIEKDATQQQGWIQCIGGNCMLKDGNPTPKTCDGNDNFTSIADTTVDGEKISEIGLVKVKPSNFSFCLVGAEGTCADQISTKKWVIGLGSTYFYEGKSGTSFDILNKNPKSINSLNDLGDNGRYLIDGDLTIDSDKNFDNNKKYIILVSKNLTINKNIIVKPGSILLFSVKGNITIGKDVAKLQGWYSADDTLMVSGGNTPDSPLEVEGALISKAASLGGGDFKNNRDLGEDGNKTCPASITIKQRLDFVLNAPVDLAPSTRVWRETAL